MLSIKSYLFLCLTGDKIDLYKQMNSPFYTIKDKFEYQKSRTRLVNSSKNTCWKINIFFHGLFTPCIWDCYILKNVSFISGWCHWKRKWKGYLVKRFWRNLVITLYTWNNDCCNYSSRPDGLCREALSKEMKDWKWIE